ncbi:CHAT domain-containing protein [Streptomyces sp. URMC 128]|uniref:CHAT domain-containing protein n=1 Tax=Streptomyces sp. URMC 128 TaxID=3423404 RepID=UPI003F1941B7
MSEALRPHLGPNDVFASWYIRQERDELITLVGDADRLLGSQRLPLAPVRELLREWELQIEDITARRGVGASRRPPPLGDLPDLVQQLGACAIPDALRDAARDPRYRRLVALPDGLVHSMPIDLVVVRAAMLPITRVFVDGVVTAPSAASFVYARGKSRGEAAPFAALLLKQGDAALEEEVETVRQALPFPSTVVRHRDQLAELNERISLLYVASHGETSTPGRAGDHELGFDWRIEFDGGGGALQADDFYSGEIRLQPGAVVVISACSVGQVAAGPMHELRGMVNALFYAGAANVLAARWPLPYETARHVFVGTVRDHYRDGTALASALRSNLLSAIYDPPIRALVRPGQWPFFFGPFVLAGAG